jgi:hypothetical protein
MKSRGASRNHSRANRLKAGVELCLIADGADFVSRPVDRITLDFSGIVGDYHAGATRRASSREPWYPRGTVLRNDRQLTIVSAVELAEVARAMDAPGINAGWIGANLVLSGVPALSLLPAGTKLLFAGGAALNVEGENNPCRTAGRSIASHFPERDGLDRLFTRVAKQKRGLVASVERAGSIGRGESVEVIVPAQRRYGPELAGT